MDTKGLNDEALATAITCTAVFSLTFVTASAASAAEGSDAAPPHVENMGTIVKAPDLDPVSTPVFSDSAAGSTTVQETLRSAPSGSCPGLYAATAPIGGGWSGEYQWIGCSFWGANASAKKIYSFSAPTGQFAPSCAQGFGYKGGKMPYWASVGCYSSDGKKVDWGKVAATPKFTVKSMIAILPSANWWN